LKTSKKTLLVSLALLLIASTELATQYFAAQIQYQAALGKPLYTWGHSPIYPPLFFYWWYKFHGDVPQTFSKALSVFSFTLIIGFALCIAIQKKLMAKKMNSHGSARWATKDEIEKAIPFNGNGVFLGKTEDGDYLRYNGPQHTIMVAPTGSGKGVGCVIPTLLTWPKSTVVMDIKGENWEKTSGYRQQKLNNLVIKFDPTVPADSAKYNPLDEIRIGTLSEIKDIQNIVNIIVDPQGKGELDHWAKSAYALLTGVILHLKYILPHPAISDVVTFFSNPDLPIQDALRQALTTQHTNSDNLFAELYRIEPTRTHPMVIQYAQEMLCKPEKEFGSIVSTAAQYINIYRDPILAHNTSSSDFCISDLMNYEKPVSLYLLFPPSDIDRMTPICRMIIELIIRRSLEDMKYRHKLLLMLDEFPSLGRLDTFERALAYIRGYGISAFLITQSINQLYKIYTKFNSIIDNCHVRIFFTPNEPETPKYISSMLGVQTIKVKSQNYNSTSLFDRSYTIQETRRELMTPDEISRMPDDTSIIFVAGRPPILAKKVFYYKDGNLEPRSKIPFPATDKIPQLNNTADLYE